MAAPKVLLVLVLALSGMVFAVESKDVQKPVDQEIPAKKDVAVEKKAVKDQAEKKAPEKVPTAEDTMVSLQSAALEVSPLFTKNFFNHKTSAYNFLQTNLEKHTFDKFTLFYPTDSALAKYDIASKNLPANCERAPMRNILAQQLVPGLFDKDKLEKLAAVHAASMAAGKRKELLPTLSPLAMSVLGKDPLTVGLVNNAYNKVVSQAKVVIPNAIVTDTYVVHLIDNMLTSCV